MPNEQPDWKALAERLYRILHGHGPSPTLDGLKGSGWERPCDLWTPAAEDAIADFESALEASR